MRNYLNDYRRVGMGLVALLSLALLSTALSATQGTQATQGIQKLIAAGQYQQALQLTEEKIQTDQANVSLLFMKGLALTKLNQLEQARDMFIALTDQHPELPEPYNNLAVVYAALGEFENAKTALQGAINTHPSYATAHENMGDIYAKMASHAYSQALELDEDNATAKTKLALVSELFSVPATRASTPAATTATEAEIETEADAESVETEPQLTAVEVENIKQTIQTRIQAWAQAWSAQDPDAYLSYYADDFIPPEKQSIQAWQDNRRGRIKQAGFINIEAANIQVMMHGQEHAQAVFSQKYESDTYQDSTTKMMLLKQQDGSWYIAEETSK